MNWKGVFPAVTTKFHADGSLDMDLFFKNLDFQLESGVHGIILGGTLGESSVLSQEEKNHPHPGNSKLPQWKSSCHPQYRRGSNSGRTVLGQKGGRIWSIRIDDPATDAIWS